MVFILTIDAYLIRIIAKYNIGTSSAGAAPGRFSHPAPLREANPSLVDVAEWSKALVLGTSG